MKPYFQNQQALFENQISGHSIFIKINAGKQVAKSCSVENNNEQNFYEWISQLEGYQEYFSEYFGICNLTNKGILTEQLENDDWNKWLKALYQKRFDSHNNKYLMLENLTYNCENLRILDVKLGFMANKESLQHRYNESTSSKIGFRLCGLKIESQGHIDLFKSKLWGRTATVEELQKVIQKFLQMDIRKKLVEEIIDKLQDLKEFINEKCMQVVSWEGCSLLIIISDNQKTKIKLIDFSKAKIDIRSQISNEDIIKSIESFETFLIQL